MRTRFLSFLMVLYFCTSFVLAQQVGDTAYKPPAFQAAYKMGKGPRVVVDAAHHNYHTADGRYKPFAELLRRDGFRVEGQKKSFSANSLKSAKILVIANAINERNAKVKDWSLPTPSAFTQEEIAAVRAWVERGGSLFLIADHMPMPGAASDLAKAFGVEFSNGYAVAGHQKKRRVPTTFDAKTGLKKSAVTRGRNESEKVTAVATFGGSAFKLPKKATPVIVFGPDSISYETKKAPGITPDAVQVPIEGWCQGGLLKIGKGRVAIFGEAAMFTAQRSGPNKKPMGMNALAAKQNYQLLLNVMHWLARVEGILEKRVRLGYAKFTSGQLRKC